MQRLLLALFWLMASPLFAALGNGTQESEKAQSASPVASTEAAGETLARNMAVKTFADMPAAGPVRVFVIPVREGIDKPLLFVVRRGLKAADKEDCVVLDMDTRGGRSDVMEEIMDVLHLFEGQTVTFINRQALSAGSIIASVTDDIYFTPDATAGSSAGVQQDMSDLPKTYRLKMNSHIRSKVEAFAKGNRYRADVVAAMMNEDFEFKVGDVVIKPKGELLNLTAPRAAQTYGEPPQPLFSSGTFKTLDALLTARFGAGNYRIERIEVTWSETLAQYITNYAGILLGLGILCLYIEFKTPGFGFFGITGGALLLVVFFGHYVAGLSGYEAALVFGLGLLLLLAELVFVPGVILPAVTGVLLMFGALLWSMVDHWPNQPLDFSGDMFTKPALNLLMGFGVALVLALLFAKFIPKGWFFSRLALSGEAGSTSQVAGLSPEAAAQTTSLVGARGVVATGLFPGGQIEIEGRRYEARLELGTAIAGTPMVVMRVSDFGLIVEVEKS